MAQRSEAVGSSPEAAILKNLGQLHLSDQLSSKVSAARNAELEQPALGGAGPLGSVHGKEELGSEPNSGLELGSVGGDAEINPLGIAKMRDGGHHSLQPGVQMGEDSPEERPGGSDPQDDPGVLLERYHSVDVRDARPLMAAADSQSSEVA